jgi:DNA mismatch repair protein MutS
MSEKLTPLLAQYRKIKEQHKDTLLLFRVGDFYEMFYEDAAIGAKALNLTLTSRPHGPDNRIPLAGVPAKALDTYVGRLVAQGFKVAVCDQLELPDARKPVVRRDVVEVITPGTVTNPNLLEAKRNNFLLALSPAADRYGIAFADVSTGEFSVAEVPAESLVEEIQKIDPTEILIPHTWERTIQNSETGNQNSECPKPPDSGLSGPRSGPRNSAPSTSPPKTLDSGLWTLHSEFTPLDDYYFTQDYAFDKLSTHFGVANLDGFGIGTMTEGICAAGAILHYLEETQRTALNHIRKISPYQSGDFLLIDRISRRNLELVERTDYEDGRPTADGTLLSVLDRTHSPAGTRLLRRWVLAPLLNVEAIRARQDAVEELSHAGSPLDEIESLLDRIGDLERISSRIALERANARDLVALRSWLDLAPEIKKALGCTASSNSAICNRQSAILNHIGTGIEDFSAVTTDIGSNLVDDPPLAVNEGGMIRPGANAELDELRALASDTKGYIARLQETERERTGIPNLRVRFNSVFGYYIEVTKSYLGQVPKNYLRKQTVVNAERFITPELKEHEARVLNAEDRIKQLELELLSALRKRVAAETGRVLALSALLAELDALASLARVARDSGYTRPVVDDSTMLEIIGGRHPVVERLLAHQFIANDARLSANDERQPPNAEVGDPELAVRSSEIGVRTSDFPQIVILTGPNMAGKSTYLRQVALIAIMAQVGSFVPATSARVGVIDKVFTRIGASDDLSRGVSTFLAEMTETANILNNATTRSLVILDEIGRGTSTSDGVAIAWATVEYLHGGHKQTIQNPESRNQNPECPEPPASGRSAPGPRLRDSAPSSSPPITLDSGLWTLNSGLSGPHPESPDSGLWTLSSGLSSPRPKTLFATHYHELTDITQLLPRCANFSFTVREQNGQVLFMRKLKPGPADKSYGIAVAKLAGLPSSVISRAQQVQADFEKGEALSIGQLAPESDLALAADGKPGLYRAPGAPRGCPEFSGGVAMAADKPHKKSEVRTPNAEVPSSSFGARRSDLSEAVLAELSSADLDNLSPLQAFDLLLRLKQRLQEPKPD